MEPEKLVTERFVGRMLFRGEVLNRDQGMGTFSGPGRREELRVGKHAVLRWHLGGRSFVLPGGNRGRRPGLIAAEGRTELLLRQLALQTQVP